MGDTTVTKIDSSASPVGDAGQCYLASGVGVAMRLWDREPPGRDKPETTWDYETVGYAIDGRAELEVEGKRCCSNRATPGSCPVDRGTATGSSSRSPRWRQHIPRRMSMGGTRAARHGRRTEGGSCHAVRRSPYAGRQLAERLRDISLDDPLILALPRGGVPVAYEIAAAFGVPVEVFVARKIGAPGHEELGIAAIAEGLDEPVATALVHQLGLSAVDLRVLAAREHETLTRRVSR